MCFEDKTCEQVYKCGRTAIFSCSSLSFKHRNLCISVRSMYVNLAAFVCVLPWLRRLAIRLAPRRYDFDPKPVHEEFVVD